MSTKPLLIVESPSKARTISKYLGGEYDVLACVGHIKDLPKKELGIDVEHDFKMTLKILPDRRKFIKELKAYAKTAPKVILATDPDREGEAIAAHVVSEIPGAKIERVQFTEITKSGIMEGMKASCSLNQHLVEAQRTRRIIDRLVGYKLSPLLWNTLQKNMKFVKNPLSAGRVQSAAVKILVDRERLRATFTSATYFDLKAFLTTENQNQFTATLFQLDKKPLARGKDFDKNTGVLANKKAMLLSRSQAAALVDELQPGPWSVTDIEEKPLTSRPRPPFTTSTLQQEAARKLRFATRKTMRLAQNLYESGFITYMRTDSTHLSSEAQMAARNYIQQRYGSDYLPPKPIQYITKVKNAQEAHEAIRPAGRRFASIAEVTSAININAGRLYELIWKRTIASQMKPARLKQTTVLITSQNAVFRTRGRVITFPGYMRVYVEDQDDSNARLSDKENILPVLRIGDNLNCENLVVEEHVTKPPPRYTEASLVKEMEAKGIGRPSTYASIIDTIQYRDYVTNRNGLLPPTFLAVAVTQLLENHFESLVDVKFTARMEDSLDAIARGEKEALPFMNSFYFGSADTPGFDDLLQKDVDIRKACTIEIKQEEPNPILARIGNYGPYLSQGSTTRSIPRSLVLGDLTIDKAEELLKSTADQAETLGIDPKTSNPVTIKEGPYGFYVQLGKTKTRKSLPKGTNPEEVDLDLALKLLSLPRSLGIHPDTGKQVLSDFGRYGPYIRMDKTNAQLPRGTSPLTVTLDEAIAVLAKKTQRSVEIRSLGKHPTTGETLTIKEGRFGPYVTDGKINASLPQGTNLDTIPLKDVVDLIDKKRAAGPTKRRRKK